LQAPVEAAQAHVQQQAVVNVDETGWHELAHGKWLWVCTTPTVTIFRVFDSRGSIEVERLLGKGYAGIIGSDRYSAYAWIDPLRRQVCWAHLKRDFQALVDRGGESQVIGQMLLARLDQFFGFWHHFRDGTLLGHRETRRTCQNILKVRPALWTFIDREGVEPTNNAAERALRRGVLWRKRSFGTQSKAGSVFVERILTTVMTLRQQKRNVLDYLTAACKAAIQGRPAPSLLPVG
jgi:transposase